ncbi:MAG: S41 family peptidase [Planctomycetota bacterium]
MNKHTRIVAAIAVFLLVAVAPTFGQGGQLFDRVAQTLERRYFDKEYRAEVLPALTAAFRPIALETKSLEDERLVVHTYLSRIPATHLALYSSQTYAGLMRELTSRETPQVGFGVVRLDGKHYVASVFEGGPAELAGLRRGDRLLSLDGESLFESPRLDWRSDDAFLPDPPVHAVLGEETATLIVERQPGELLEIVIEPEPYSAWEAAKASVRVEEVDGERIGYVHFWLVHMSGPGALLEKLFEGPFADCSALVLDLRGRGGNAAEVDRILSALQKKWRRPTIALIDRGTRSAKEVLAYEFKERELGWLLGEPTAGAVIPATFEDVGSGAVLMFPSFILGKYTQILEHHPVEPHIVVEDDLPYANGKDPIADAGFEAAVQAAKGKNPAEGR